MTKSRFRVPDIKSWTPALDARNSEETFVLTGRNYIFDSKGPKSGFGTRLIQGLTSIENEAGLVQSISVANRTFVFSTTGVREFEPYVDREWKTLLDLTPYDYVVFNPEKKWTGAFVAGGVYFCHESYGFFKLNQLSITKKTQDDILGLVDRPIAVAECNGRLIILGQNYVGWSAPNDAENFVPELGGAGQQLLSEWLAGQPKTLMAFESGFIVYTSNQAMLAEYIGGDAVWRFSRFLTDQIPLGPWAVDQLPDGSQLMCTKQGIHHTEDGQNPKKIVPIFNEFLRSVLEHEAGITVRINYQMEVDRLYVQLRDWTNHYIRTYALQIALDKWGEFSERHLGIIKYRPQRGYFGYVDQAGVAHRFRDWTRDRETAPHEFEGLNSMVELGYVKPPELHGARAGQSEIDSLLEMHEITIGGRARPSWSVPTHVDLGALPDPVDFEADYAIVLDWVTNPAEPIYWLRHAAAPAGEYFTDLTQLLTTPLNLDTITSGLGLKVSYDSFLTPEDETDPKAINELHETIDTLIHSESGATFIFEVDSAFAPDGPFFYFRNADDSEYMYGYTAFPNGNQNLTSTYRPLAELGLDDHYFFFEYFNSEDVNAWGINKYAFAIEPTIGGGYKIAFALNGVKVFEGESEDSPLSAFVLDSAFLFTMGSGEGWNMLDDAPGSFYVNDVYARRVIGFNDGDITKLEARSALSTPKPTTEVISGVLVNGTYTTLQLAVPATASVGDLLTAIVYGRSALTPPAGWTLEGSDAWAIEYGSLEVVVTQTLYCYSRVCEAGDIGATIDFTFAIEGKAGGVITAFHKPLGGTPEIREKQITKNLNSPAIAVPNYYVLSAFGDTGNQIPGVKCPEFTSDREDAIAYCFSAVTMYANLYWYESISNGIIEHESDSGTLPTLQVIDDEPMDMQVGSFGTNSTTFNGYLSSWTLQMNSAAAVDNRLLAMWKPLPRNQVSMTQYITVGTSSITPLVSWNHRGTTPDSFRHYDDRSVVGTLIIA